MDNNYLKAFLSEARRNLLQSNKPKWLVIGNESSDLDSVICSIVYSYYKQSITKEKYILIPVVSIPKRNVESKKDVIYWLNFFNINYSTDLIYLEEILLLDNLSFYHDLRITLVDHHKPIKSIFTEFIKEVIDHREMTFEYLTNQLEIKNIQMVGSCSTLIASYILKSKLLLQRNDLLKMLYGVILLDTDCLDPTNNRTTQVDIDTCNEIENILTMTEENRLEIYSVLRNAKSDISELTFIQKIQRDVKCIDVTWKGSNIKIAIPTVIGNDIEDFLSMDDIKSQSHQALIELEANVLIILTCGRDSIKRRGIMIFAEESDLRNRISQFLIKESQLQLQQIQIEIPCDVIIFVEDGLLTTRKLFIPLLEKCFSQESDSQYNFQSNNCNIYLYFDEIDSFCEEIEQGGPYTLSTPKRSCSGSPDSRNSDMNLPSLNNRRTLALIDQKRQKHIAEIEVIEDENEDNVKNFGDDESPLAYTPENSDEEESDSEKNIISSTQIINPLSVNEHKFNLKSTENKENSLKTIEDNLSIVKKGTFSIKGNQFSKLQKPDKWNKDLNSLSTEVDKKRQKLETSHYDSILNTIAIDISKTENMIKTENIYKKILSNWSDSYSEEEKCQFLRIIETDDKLNMAQLLTTGIIRDCISEFDVMSIISNIERNNSAITKDIDDTKSGAINDLSENEEETFEDSLPDSTIPDLEINYNSCPVDTIINKDCQGVSNIGNQSGFDIENSSFNLYRRISKNQLDFTEDEKKLFAFAGNWYPEEDVIYSDNEQEHYQMPDNEAAIEMPKKIIYPNNDITMNLTKH